MNKKQKVKILCRQLHALDDELEKQYAIMEKAEKRVAEIEAEHARLYKQLLEST